MTVTVCFMSPTGIGDRDAPGIGYVRTREDLAIPATTTNSTEDGEFAIIFNGESDPVAVAFGTDPDADTTASTSASSAGFIVPVGQISDVIVPPTGTKINVKAIS